MIEGFDLAGLISGKMYLLAVVIMMLASGLRDGQSMRSLGLLITIANGSKWSESGSTMNSSALQKR